MRFIHYGHRCFDKEKFMPIQNQECWNKPRGGFWASPVESELGWKSWCEDNDFGECDEQNSVIFSLKPEANIYHICSVEAANNLPRSQSSYGINEMMPETPYSTIMGVDFESMVKAGIDAIFYELSVCPQLYWKLYGWDCDCILVMNPDIVVPETASGEKERT